MNARDALLALFVVLTMVFASTTVYESGIRTTLTSTSTSTRTSTVKATMTSTSFSTMTSTETITSTTTTVSTTKVVSVSTVTATSSAAFVLSVHVERPTYTTNQTILVNGSVSPVPQPPSYVFISVISPTGNVTTATSRVGMTNGSYTYALMAGGSPFWVTGVYTVVAVSVAFGATETATTQFVFVVPVT